jgi:hypothetical protein
MAAKIGAKRIRVARWYFSKQKSQFGYVSEGLGMEKKSIYSMFIWNTLRPFGTFYGHLEI